MSKLWKASVVIVILAMITNVAYQLLYGFTAKKIALLIGMLVYVGIVALVAKFEADDDKED